MARGRYGLFKRGNVWHVRTDPVTGSQMSTGCRDLKAAQLWHAKRERLAADPAQAAADQANLGEWCAAAVREARTSATASFMIKKLNRIIEAWGQDCRLGSITPILVDRYVAERREKVTDHTIVKELGALRRALKLAKRAGCYPADISVLKPPGLHTSYDPKRRALSVEEVPRLLSELDPDKGALVALCVGLGVRLSECRRLLPSDIDLRKGEVFIGGRKTKKSRRTVPILSVFRPLVEAALPYLPVTWTNNVYRDLTAACVRAGIERCTPNDLRRTQASILRAAGVEPDVIRRLLGHTSQAMVDQVYAQLTPAELARLAERGIRDNLATVRLLPPTEPGTPSAWGRLASGGLADRWAAAT